MALQTLDSRIEHPLRRSLMDEVHARPSLGLSAPAVLFHFAWLGDYTSETLAALCRQHEAPGPSPARRHGLIQQNDGWIKWECHTEFVTCCFLRPDNAPADTWPGPPPDVTQFIGTLPGSCLVALILRVAADAPGTFEPARLTEIFPSGELVGSSIAAGDGMVWTDFRLDPAGFGRMLVRNIRMTPGRLGRAVQRLLEVETYRMMALLGLPLAREISDELGRLENALTSIAARTADASRHEEDHELLDQLTHIAADAAALSARSRYRFSATAAYAQLVERRLSELREDRIDGLSRVSAFLERRFHPATSTCASCVRRMDVLAGSIDQAADMLRTRVDVNLEAQNSNLLRAMESRSRTQLRIQEAVEGLSVFAISYYLIALLKILVEGLLPEDFANREHVIAAIAVPVVLAAVWLGVRRLRRVLKSDH
ncbi:MAG TPA: DUF3422 domain-containing protein [Terriglobia bacterium]|nr:DUF3422 domain-containing protein [Terriglobia bacterium]